jgi:hypothetical protein
MLVSEALTIWMLRIAMKAPSVEPTTATQVISELWGVAAGTGFADEGKAGAAIWAVMAKLHLSCAGNSAGHRPWR